MPSIARTWSPLGRTPQVKVAGGNWTKISAISAISVSPQKKHVALYLRLHREKNIRKAQVREFLSLLLRHIRGPIVLLWDRNTIHRAERIKQFLEEHRRLHDHFFPGYAPELNPDEYVWAKLKKSMANLRVPRDVQQLSRALSNPIRRLRRSQSLLWSCILASDLPWER